MVFVPGNPVLALPYMCMLGMYKALYYKGTKTIVMKNLSKFQLLIYSNFFIKKLPLRNLILPKIDIIMC